MNNKVAKLVVVIASLSATSAFAVASGFYLGLTTGPATNTAKDQLAYTETPPPLQVLATSRSNQWATRLFMGYKINDYAGFEGGFNYFSDINYNTQSIPTCSGANVRVKSLDILGRGDLPLFGGFGVFGKAGVGLTYITNSGTFIAPQPGATCGRSNNQFKFTPEVGLGASYDFNQSWVGEASWNRMMVGSMVGNLSYYAIGFSYHFVNTYCGQFLCD